MFDKYVLLGVLAVLNHLRTHQSIELMVMS